MHRALSEIAEDWMFQRGDREKLALEFKAGRLAGCTLPEVVYLQPHKGRQALAELRGLGYDRPTVSIKVAPRRTTSKWVESRAVLLGGQNMAVFQG